MANIAPKGCINVLILAIVRCRKGRRRITYNIGGIEYIVVGWTVDSRIWIIRDFIDLIIRFYASF